jgi:hypothetical protein
MALPGSLRSTFISTPLCEGSEEKVIAFFDDMADFLVFEGGPAKTLTLANKNNAVNLIEFFMTLIFKMFLFICRYFCVYTSK